MGKASTIDEALEIVGEYGRYQKFLDLVFCLLNMPIAIQILMMTFATVTPEWRCKSTYSSSPCAQVTFFIEKIVNDWTKLESAIYVYS